jgi:hypothetical protein
LELIVTNEDNKETDLKVFRYENKDSGTNENTIISLIKDANTKRICFFASSTISDESNSNLPLMVALAEYVIPCIGSIHVVFDGNFLTAARRPRYLEVKRVLDKAEMSGKAFFCIDRVPFTSNSSPEVATEQLLSSQRLELLTADTRKHYFALLSNIAEENYP